VPSVIAVDITGQLLELADDIESAHSLNVTVLEADFAKFANLSGKTEIDFKTVTSELKRFQSLEAMHKFDPVDIKWKEGITVTNTVQALSYGFTLVLFISMISLCCKRCSLPALGRQYLVLLVALRSFTRSVSRPRSQNR
jgi:hypothetical protein